MVGLFEFDVALNIILVVLSMGELHFTEYEPSYNGRKSDSICIFWDRSGPVNEQKSTLR